MLNRITWVYLLLPFVIFCAGWLRIPVAIPVILLSLWAMWQLAKPGSGPTHSQSVNLLPTIMIAFIWVFLSGVGGYAFQNWDHHWRNAVFRDLVTNSWPVIYAAPDKGPFNILVYYIGYWLPAALAGRVFGWGAANFALFLWTWFGVTLTALHISGLIKASPAKSILLLIFFSGLDALGTLFFADTYPRLWPPITHLEIWPGDIQYSSFTTQLFWVFNQSVPAWLCTALIAKGIRRDESALAWALGFFLAPLASLGLAPYVFYEWLKQTDPKALFKSLRWDVAACAALIVLVSFAYFSSNPAAQERGLQSIALQNYLAFLLLEGGLLFLLLAPSHFKNIRWWITLGLFAAMPFVQFGSGRDFVMRASISPLFFLMLMAGEAFFHGTKRALRIACAVLLLLGALTPLYEINRSVYRTFEYYFILEADQRVIPAPVPATRLEQNHIIPEREHPNAILADEIYSLRSMKDKLSKNFIANVRQSFYYRYLMPR